MKFSDPLAVKCPRCATESRHNSNEVLALRAICPECKLKLDDMGKRMAAQLDEALAFETWAKVLMGVEDRLGIRSPGISDAQVHAKTPVTQLSLRDLVWLVQEYLPPGPDSESVAQRVVIQAAESVAAKQVLVSSLDRPLLQSLGLFSWVESHGPAQGG